MNAKDLLDTLRPPPQKTVAVRYAVIAAGYTSGRPQLRFEGETTDTTATYPYLGGYSPVAGDRVQVIDGVVHGPIL